MTTRFEQEDARVSADSDRLHGEPVIWRPMAARIGGVYTRDDPRLAADQTRPVRTDLIGIVSWAPSVSAISGARITSDLTGAAIGNIACTVDFALPQFGGGQLPRKGDRLELPNQPHDVRYLDILRVGNWTPSRRSYHCAIVNAP